MSASKYGTLSRMTRKLAIHKYSDTEYLNEAHREDDNDSIDLEET